MPIKYIDIFLQFKVLYGKIIRSRCEMSLVVYNSLIEKIDGFFTELFSELQETISWSSFWILVAGIVVGFVICSSIYSILLFKSINNQEEKIKANAFIASDELVQEIVENIKKSYVEDTEGLMVRERFEVLGSKLYLEINQIATLYYPTSKYPLYELTIEEMILFLHYLSNRIDEVFDHPILKPFKKISVSKIFEIIDTKKRIDENKIVKATKKAHVGKIKSFLIDAVKIINPIHWFKKLVVNSTISFATRKISLIIIDIVADESNKTYSKKIFDKEKSIREMEIEQILEELEKEEQDA